ncbi:MAG: hypothetical protein EXR90_04120 [Methyloglobulus sp.]|nr:hypothetical protein [Pseudomonadota bacterium]MSS76070.1 hypothetical protein [Methyloglobulus sp.]
MKTVIFSNILLVSTLLFSVTVTAEKAAEDWQNTTITDSTIKKIQESKYEYKKCVGEQMQKPDYQKMDSRNATDAIIKHCEPVLSKIREVYLAEKVPGVIADRHLRQIRTQITRNALQGLMFEQAARKAGQP